MLGNNLGLILCFNINIEKPVVAQGHKCVTINATGCVGFSLEEMKYLIFSFFRSGVETKRDVEFHHLTRNASRNRRKVESEVS